MQMLYIKLFLKHTALLILLLQLIPVCSANSRFIDQFQINPEIDEIMANRIVTYYTEDIPLPLAQQKVELLDLIIQLDNVSSQFSNKAVYWFINGLLHRNIASYYTDIDNSQSAKSHINSKNMAYKKAIELSSTPNNQLSAAIFSTMKHGLPQDLKIAATQNEIALGGNGEDDSYYWYLHWSNIDQLEKAGRKEEAKAAYKKMQKELKQSDMDMTIYKSLTKKIETETLNLSRAQTPKTQAPVKKTAPEPVKKEKAKPFNTKYKILFSVILFSVFVLILVGLYEYMRVRKNSKTK